jgi:hypothetical protein
MRQEGVLLALVEAMHLVDEDDGALGRQTRLRQTSLFDGLTDVLDAAEHRADGDELRVESPRHQAGDGGLAHTGWAPEDAAMRLAGLEGDAQGHAGAEQVLLADHVGQGDRAQLFGQGRVRGRLRGGHGASVGARSGP